MSDNVHRHPEWKRLVDELVPLLQIDRVFTYPELSALAGLDVRSPRGRGQFIKAQRHILGTCKIYLQNVRDLGYRAIRPDEHGTAAQKQVKRARRRLRVGGAIATNCNFDVLAAEQRKALADMACRIGAQLQDMKKLIRENREDVKRILGEERKRLPSPMIESTSNQVLQ